MAHRTNFLRLLAEYSPASGHEVMAKQQMIDFVESNVDCFERSNLKGHITGSCWLISPDENSVLLTHHKKIGLWLQLGGHADGDGDLLRVALKEAHEESGIDGIKVLSPAIFDLDIHEIGEHNGVPKHLHYDVRFALLAPSKLFAVSCESYDLAWFAITDLASDDKNPSLARMAKRWLDWQ